MIKIKNFKIFTCDYTNIIHWSRIKFKGQMDKKIFDFSFGKIVNSNLQNGEFSRCSFKKTILNKSKMNFSKFMYCDFTESKLKQTELKNCNFSYSIMKKSNLENCNASYCNFRGCNLQKVNFKNSILYECDFRYADLRKSDLSNCNIEGTDFRYSKLEGAKLTAINNKEVIINDFIIIYPVGKQNLQLTIFATNIGIVVLDENFYGSIENYKKEMLEKGEITEEEFSTIKKLINVKLIKR